MEKIPTAKEFLNILDERDGTLWTENDEDICKAFIEFAKLHVKAALKAASDSTKQVSESALLYDFEKEIINAYPLENIK